MLEMLDEYSRGKVLTIQTQKKRRIKNKKANKAADIDEEMEYSDDESEQEENVERQFNFVSELSVLVDYDVINKYMFAIQNERLHKEKPFLIKASA